ncbi:MAG: PQQ-dependent sugar dehydrogenase, partial [Caldilineaceae bacterium]|nr:PQQ-dependent sugar dehydrogenase [Caldilineaceae bacterium]
MKSQLITDANNPIHRCSQSISRVWVFLMMLAVTMTGALIINIRIGLAQTTTEGSDHTDQLAAVSAPDLDIGFSAGKLANVAITNPTSLQFGPDDRLYVSEQKGLIKAYTIIRSGPGAYTATMTETIRLIQEIPNHNDDGSLASNINERQVTGLLATGTAANPVLYVSSSDPRTFVTQNPASSSIDTNSGIISRLRWNGTTWDKVDLVRGLSRSKENHSVNGMTLDKSTNTLYLMVGGNTNMGAPSTSFAALPEYALSAALLMIDLDAIGDTTYDLPTLDDEDRAGVNDANDPFGGNAGKNQAILDPAGPVQVYAPGWRNAYDIVLHSSGKLYTVDNGSNIGWGNSPTDCTNTLRDNGSDDTDVLQYISGQGYYGGHPNPTRGNVANTFNTGNPQSPVPSANTVECTYIPSGDESGALTTYSSSTNGLVEYTASNFSGALQGNLLAASYSGHIWRMQLNATGDGLAAPKELLLANFDTHALDVTAQPDDAIFPGTIWVATYYNGPIWVFEPNDNGIPCSGADDPNLDEDGDGFSNADEIDNDTNPCSGGSLPADHDGDKISNLNDPDDDNDGINDTADLFALDPDNGADTTLPVNLTWNNGDPNPGGILNLGFTGLMHNGTNYTSLYDADEIVPGGA